MGSYKDLKLKNQFEYFSIHLIKAQKIGQLQTTHHDKNYKKSFNKMFLPTSQEEFQVLIVKGDGESCFDAVKRRLRRVPGLFPLFVMDIKAFSKFFRCCKFSWLQGQNQEIILGWAKKY